MPQTIGDAALGYAKRGWSVLPIRPQDKRPYMTEWMKYTHCRASADDIEKWFGFLAEAGVGVVTGKISGIVVLDVDDDCPDTLDDILHIYPTDMVARTGGGGYHLYYHYPDNVEQVKNRVRFRPGMDIRGDGGFIVLPPTIHSSGVKYEWIKTGDMGDYPGSLLSLPDNQIQRSGDGWVAEVLRGVSKGGRNNACARLAGYFYRRGMSISVIEEILSDWNDRNDPPMPIREVKTTVESIGRWHQDKDSTTVFTSVDFENDSESVDNNSGSKFDLVRASEYIRDYGGEGVTWAVKDWLPDSSITFLVSPPESYKTWLLLDLAVSMSTNTPFLGSYEVNTAGPVIIIQQEDSHQGLTERLSLIMEQRMGGSVKLGEGGWQIPSMPDIPIYIHPSRMLRFDKPEVLKELEKQIAEVKPVAVLIDPLYSTTSQVDNYMADLANQMMVLKNWRDKYGCSFVIAHHSKKNLDPDSTAREDSWGSQFLNAFLEAGWQIRRNPRLADNEVVVRRHSKVMGNQEPVSLKFNISTTYPMKYSVDVTSYKPAVKQDGSTAQAILLDELDMGPLSQADLANRTGKNRSTISRQIKSLEASGMIARMPDGRIRRLKGGE